MKASANGHDVVAEVLLNHGATLSEKDRVRMNNKLA
jgi:hypothetical protein